MPDFSAGTAFLSIVPTLLGDRASIQEQLDRATEGVKAQAAVNAELNTASVEKIDEALASIPNRTVTVGVDESRADAKLDELRTRLEALRDKTIGVDISAGAAMAELTDIRAELERVGAEHPNVQVSADIADASAKLDEVKAKADDLAAKNPNVRVSADTADADTKMAATGAEAAKLNGMKSLITVGDGGSSNATRKSVFSLTTAILGLGPAAIPVAAVATGALAGIGTGALAAGAGLGVLKLAFSGVGGAVSALSKAQADQQATGKATKAELDNIKKSMDGLSPAAQNMARTMFGLKGTLDGMRATAASGLFPGVIEGLHAITPLFPVLNDIIGGVARAMGGLARDAGKALTDPFWTGFFGYIRNTAGPTITTLGRIFGDVFKGIAGVIQGAKPMWDGLSAGIKGVADKFAAFGASAAAGGNASFNGFMAYVRANGPLVVKTLLDVVQAVGHVIVSLAPAGPTILKLVDAIARFITSLPPGVIAGMVSGLGLLLTAWRLLHRVVSLLFTPLLLARLAIKFLGVAVGDMVKPAMDGAGSILTLAGHFLHLSSFRSLLETLFRVVGAGLEYLGKAILGAMGPFAVLIGIFTYLFTTNKQFHDSIMVLLGALGQVVGALVSSVQPVFTALANILGGSVAPAIADFASSLVSVLAPILTFVAGLLNGLVGIIKFIAPVLGPVIVVILGIVAAMKAWSIIQGIMNVLLAANPLGLVVLGLTILVTAVIYAYQHFQWFHDIVSTALHAVADVALWLWHNVLEPAAHGIGAVWQWLSDNVFTPVSDGISTALHTVADVALWLWHNVFKPVADGIGISLHAVGDVFVWLRDNVVTPVTNAIKDAWQKLSDKLKPLFDTVSGAVGGAGGAMLWLRDSVVTPVTNAIKDAWKKLWDNIGPIWGKIVSVIRDDIIPQFQKLWFNVIKPVCDFIGEAWGKLWNGVLKPVLDEIGGKLKWVGIVIGILFVAPIVIAIALVVAAFLLIGLAIAVVLLVFAALIGGVEWVYNNWSRIWTAVGNFFVGIWDWIKGTAIAVWTSIKDWFSNEWALFKLLWTTLWNDISSFFVGIWDWIRDTAIAVWNYIKDWFSNEWALFKQIWGGVWDWVKQKFSDIWNGIKSTASSIWQGIKQVIQDGVNGVIDGINWMVDKINSVLGLLSIPKIPLLAHVQLMAAGGVVGLESGGVLKMDVIPQYASGTGRIGGGFMTNGPQAIVGEGNPAHPEFVIPTDPKYRKRAMGLYQSLGAQLMDDGGVLGWLGSAASSAWTGVTSAANAVGGSIDDVIQWFIGVGGGVMDKVVDAVKGMISNPFFASIGAALAKMIGGGLSKMFASANPGGAGVQRWAPIALQALAMAGAPASWLPLLLAQMQTESGGNPAAINLTDSNAAAGNPSQGLMQTVPSTFARFAGPLAGLGILNPLANIYAAIKYVEATYGSPVGVWGQGHGYASGGVLGYDSGGYLPPGLTLAYNGTGRPEPVVTPSQFSAVASGGGGGGSFVGTLTLDNGAFIGQVEGVINQANADQATALAGGRRV